MSAAYPTNTYGNSTYGGSPFGGSNTSFGGTKQALQFFDETGINPLPAGIKVTVINAQNGALLGSAWTRPLGLLMLDVPPVECIATFSLSAQAPSVTVSFVPDGVQQPYPVSVAPYRSPSLSPSGYTMLQMLKLVRGWYGDAAKQPGGITYAIGAGGGAGLASMDAQIQAVIAMMRLSACIGSDIDTWSMDMVGPLFSRYPKESDPLFTARNKLMVARPRCTINAITAFVEAFYASILAGWQVTGSESLAFDSAGGLDKSGGLDVAPTPTVPQAVPPIVVWDAMTEPNLAQEFSITAPEFVIQIGNLTASLKEMLAYNETGGLDISGAFNISPSQSSLPTPTSTAPDPRLGTMINLIAKAAGTVPMYLIGQI